MQQRAWRAYMDGHQRLMAALNRQLQRDADLSLAEYRILVLLSEAPDRRMRMSELADGVLSSRSRLTHQITRLESEHLVRRSTCLEDGRGVLAQLTDDGMRRLEFAAPGHVEEVRQDFIDMLTPTQLEVIGDAFARIDRALGSREP
ncbi:MarR family winged helix-turn-helix transcriptional regulator [Nocardia arizonensis]|uniref:MarR family winged helix-turn-helix transcriptional regulator n=1 Tax=Nocardia arizonensis TaxID=1141647 RepID=UPI0006D1ED51|nr:MarR family transcriptional regulator [Nocardia arizonensis]